MIKGKDSFYCKYIKRVLDILCALAAMIVFCWLFALIAVLVRINLGSRVIFKQKRPGLNEKIFTLYKFRTMTDERDENGELLPDEVRLTAFGKKLRSTSLDELPEAWNILKGDMSVIGPRPQLVRDMIFMTPEQRKRHSVRPGLSGLAQVNGRNSISWEGKMATDLEYINSTSLWLDVKIVVLTVKKALERDGITSGDMDTSEDFGDYLLRIGNIDIATYNERITASSALMR